ncbi:SLC13 family permease [Halospeciosus flavus]|uniref:SLC13 family permease n=1 Tax=Halospeciosus flavus TaxID=3032283 RepID=A0ABD5Z810_9EURY|nr:SLC13 family permease [Halospeciosus flavus]
MSLPSLLLQTSLPWGLTPDVLVVFAIVALALGLFVTELIPIDLTAILVMVLLMVLEPWTQISPKEGISGFASTATITVLAMLILSTGISRTGVVQKIGNLMADFAGDDPMRQLAATVGIAGPTSGFINNTPVVAILVPVISDLAHEGKTSPSKLLMPLSFASMFGGMLTLIGTSTNILASDVAARLAEDPQYAGLNLHAFSMFEFTQLGIIVLVVGSIYLMTVGYWLLPERVLAEEDYVEEYDLEEFLTEVVVQEESPIVGHTVEEAGEASDLDFDILQIRRDGEEFIEPLDTKTIREGDLLKVRTDRETLEELIETDGLSLTGTLSDEELEQAEEEQNLVEIIIPARSKLVGESLASSTFRDRYNVNVLAFRSRGAVIRERMDQVPIRVGDTLLVQATSGTIDRLSQNRDFIVAHEPEDPDYRTGKIPHAVGIIAGVIGFAALPDPFGLNIVVSALAGVVAMVFTGVLKPNEIYDSVDWNVIFLLAGVIPLGIALEQTGAAELIGNTVASTADFLPVIGVLWVFYTVTALLTNVVSNNASVVLMIPVAVEAAQKVGANAFAFVLAVTFAASTAFMTPVGYQTNLFVYGPGGYKFSDFVRVGGPLQFLLSIVTTLGIAFFWGLRPPA